jgi:hypothetical protein
LNGQVMSESDDSDSNRENGSGREDGGDRANGDRRENSERRERDERRDRSKDGRKPPPSPAKLARRACNDLAELIGREVEGVVSLQRTDDGWSVGVEVLETARIPDTADVLAEYEVNADRRGRLVGYQRVRRYTRGSTRDER